MTYLIAALGLLLLIEGALYALFPYFMRRACRVALYVP